MSTPQKYVTLALKVRENYCSHIGGHYDGHHCLECVEDKMTADIAAALHEAAKDAVRGAFTVEDRGWGRSQNKWEVRTSFTPFWGAGYVGCEYDQYDTESEADAAREKLVEELTR